MGIGGLHIWHLLILAVVAMLLFGAKGLRNAGADLRAAVRGFRLALADDREPAWGEGAAAPAEAPTRRI